MSESGGRDLGPADDLGSRARKSATLRTNFRASRQRFECALWITDIATTMTVKPDQTDHSDVSTAGPESGDPLDDLTDRRLYRLAAVLVLIPILVDTVRQGVDGWFPTRDAAITVLDASHSIATHPRLVGMFAAGASREGMIAYFPGPWELWWLWGPTRILGATWGPLLAMAALNIGWMLLAGWCVRRAFGYRAAIGALAFLGILNWSFGAGLFHDPTPMVVIAPAFSAFLFVTWALASGDSRALPVCVIIANFLLLDHLALTFTVPAIVLVGVASWGAVHLRMRLHDRARWREARPRCIRAVLWSAGISVVAWTPSIVEEFRHEPGNLTILWRSWLTQSEPTTSASGALGAGMALFTRWPFWLRGGLDVFMDPFAGVTPATGFQIGVAALIIVGGVAVAWFAWKRRDRAVFTAMVFAEMLLVIAYLNMLRSPGKLLFQWYYVANWSVAMFVTFAFAFAFVRSVPIRIRRVVPAMAVGVAAVVSLLNIPHTSVPPSLAGGNDDAVAIVRELDAQITGALRGRAMVNPVLANGGDNAPNIGLFLILDQAKIPYCQNLTVFGYELEANRCDPAKPVQQLVLFPTHVPPNNLDERWTIATASLPFPDEERDELRKSTRRVRQAVGRLRAADRGLPLSPGGRRVLDEVPEGESLIRSQTDSMTRTAPRLDTPMQRRRFASVIDYWARWSESADASPRVMFDLPGIDDDELLHWASSTLRWLDSSYTAALVPPKS